MFIGKSKLLFGILTLPSRCCSRQRQFSDHVVLTRDMMDVFFSNDCMARGKNMHRDNKRVRTFVKHFVNPLLYTVARASPGPFALLRHVGRLSGKSYEIPIMVWRMQDGFVIVLTYGPRVDLQAVGQGSLRWHKQEYIFQKPELIDANTALPMLPPFLRYVLLRRNVQDFVKLPSQLIA